MPAVGREAPLLEELRMPWIAFDFKMSLAKKNENFEKRLWVIGVDTSNKGDLWLFFLTTATYLK